MAELRHLRYFVAVAEELSFTRAADRLHTERSPLSAAIRSPEQELGAPLFADARQAGSGTMGTIRDDAVWPPGADVVALTTARWAARRPEHLWAAPLAPAEHIPLEPAWRADDESPLLERFLEVARC